MTDPNNATQYVIEATERVLAELADRLGGDEESNELAYRSAISKAVLAGFQQGYAAYQFAAEQQGFRIVNAGEPPEVVDLWAERYGQDD